MRNVIMEKRVGVVNQEATTLTSLENVSMWCPSSEHLARITKMERFRKPFVLLRLNCGQVA